MRFDLKAATYQVNTGYYSLQIPVTGGVTPYTYTFQMLPPTWMQTDNTINIPILETNPGNTWALKVIVTDALGNKLQRSLVIKVSNGGDPLIGDYSYDQVFSYSSAGTITSIPSSTFSSSSSSSTTSSTSTSTSSYGTGFGSASSSAGVISLQTSGSGINTVLPTSS